MSENPLIWVLRGARVGDTAQAIALALCLSNRVVIKDIKFNILHHLPSLLLGAGVAHLTGQSRAALQKPWPDLVIATGRRTASVSLWIKVQSGGHSKAVQLGRPRLALAKFDLVVTTPQYGLPPAANVVTLPLPFHLPKTVDAPTLQGLSRLWDGLPKPWIMAVVGGGKYPQRMTKAALQTYGVAIDAYAEKHQASVLLFSSPRSPAQALHHVAAVIGRPLWRADQSPAKDAYQGALARAQQFTVTSDSVSMTTDMLATGKPCLVFDLPGSPLSGGWSAEHGVLAGLARAGVVSPPRDVAALIAGLRAQGVVGDLAQMTEPWARLALQEVHENLILRIRSLLV